jgi:hypothetical protein
MSLEAERTALAQRLEDLRSRASRRCLASVTRGDAPASPDWRVLFEATVQAGMAEAYRRAADYVEQES